MYFDSFTGSQCGWLGFSTTFIPLAFASSSLTNSIQYTYTNAVVFVQKLRFQVEVVSFFIRNRNN